MDKEKFVLVSGGEYKFGLDHVKWNSVLPEWERNRTEVIEKVNVGDFIIARHLVTFDDYDTFCKETNRPLPNDQGWGRGKRPVINITWLDAIKYCNWLSKQQGLPEAYTDDGKLCAIDLTKKLQPTTTTNNSATKTTTTTGSSTTGGISPRTTATTRHVKHVTTGQRITNDTLSVVEGYRLPSDFEWEYSAKGGKQPGQTIYIGSNNVDEVAWFKDNTVFSTNPVGLKKANELGIYDLPGNVFEYCTDGHNDIRVLRGGGWSSRAESMRPSYKNGCSIYEAHSYVGFRIARSFKIK